MSSVFAQTVSFAPITPLSNIYAGANYAGKYTNTTVKVTLSGSSFVTANAGAGIPVTLSATPVTGVTYGFSANNFTNSQNFVYMTVAVTNVAKGTYPITITATTNSVTCATTNYLTLIVGNLWTNNGANTSWSSPVNSTLGGINDGDDVMFQDAGSNTNYVDASHTLSSLTFIRNTTATNQNMAMATGTTLTITNGFLVTVDTTNNNSKTTGVNISGVGAAIIVTNQAINAAINSVSTGSTGTTNNMSGLDTFKVYANRFAVGDYNFATAGGVGAQLVIASLAKTNLVMTAYNSAVDFSSANTNELKYAVSVANNGTTFNNGSIALLNLGIYSQFMADSIGFGTGRAGGANAMQFNPAFTNSQAPYLSFRNADGVSRVSAVAIGVDSGGTGTGSNTKYNFNLNNGYVDMLVDTMIIGRVRNTNFNAQAVSTFTYNYGAVNVNTLRLGYQAFGNTVGTPTLTTGKLTLGGGTVGTNAALLSVNTELNLGYTAGDLVSGVNSAQCWGQVIINTNATVSANAITVGTLSTNNQIIVNNGGTLFVTNTIASTANYLALLALTNGRVTLAIHSGVTNIFANNVFVSGTPKINIASVPYSNTTAATNVIIQYSGAAPAAGLGIGTIPANFNNMSLVTDTSAKTISLVNAANSPKNLVWRGPGSVWDHSSFNWVDTNANVSAKFTDGDHVVFDDQSGVPTNITIMEVVLPSQSGTGILFTNSVNSYFFTTNSAAASGIDGGPAVIKSGTATVEIDGYANMSVQLNKGKITGTGLLGSLTSATNTFLGWAGEILSPVTIGGTATNSGVFDSGLTLSAGGALTNVGTINGAFAVSSGATLNNSGTLQSIGASTVAAGGSLINNGGTLSGISLAIGGTFFDSGTIIKLSGLLDILGNATFIPGGNGIGTTTVKQNSFSDPSTAGTVKFESGSTNIFKADYGAVGQKNTMVLANLVLFGGSSSNLKTNGGVLSITNIGTTAYANGQSFQLVGAQPSAAAFDPSQFTLNTTNTYPVMQPAYLAVGLSWDLSQTIFNGIVTVTTSTLPTTPTTITSTVSGNVLTLSWPSGYTGWRLLQQTNSLNVGLGTNWTIVPNSTATNSFSITNSLTTPAAFYELNYPYP